MAPTEPSAAKVLVEPQRYVVSLFPHDDQRRRYWSVYLERMRGDRWAVTDGMDGSGVQMLDARGVWGFPAGCDDVPGRYWHDWETAVALAIAEAPQIVVNDVSALEAMERHSPGRR